MCNISAQISNQNSGGVVTEITISGTINTSPACSSVQMTLIASGGQIGSATSIPVTGSSFSHTFTGLNLSCDTNHIMVTVGCENADCLKRIELPVYCPPDCPNPQITNIVVGDDCDSNGDRQITATVDFAAPCNFEIRDGANVLYSGFAATSGPETFSFDVVAGQFYTLDLVITSPAGCSGTVLQVSTSNCPISCPTITTDGPNFSDCDASGQRSFTYTITASSSGPFSFDVQYSGTVVATLDQSNNSYTISDTLPAGANVDLDILFGSPSYCSDLDKGFSVPACTDPITDPDPDPDPTPSPAIKCVVCTKCADWIAKKNNSILFHLLCKALMGLVIASIAFAFVTFVTSGNTFSWQNPNSSQSIVDIFFGINAIAVILWIAILYWVCGPCCVYCAIKWGLIFGVIAMIVAAIVLTASGNPFPWLQVIMLIWFTFIAWMINEQTYLTKCNESI